jgi:hypothetical protein
MDSGYFDENIIKVIEEVNCKYVIKAKGYITLIEKLLAAGCDWQYSEDKQITEIITKIDKWESKRRFVIARRSKPDIDRRQLLLDINIECGQYFAKIILGKWSNIPVINVMLQRFSAL